MGINVYFSPAHAASVSKSIETAIYAMYDNSPDDADYLDVLHRVATDLRYVKNQLDDYVEAMDYEQRLSGHDTQSGKI